MHLVRPSSTLWADFPTPPFTAPDVVAWLLFAGVCVPLYWWRRRPVTAFMMSWTALVALIIGDYMVGWMPFVAWILLYGVGAFSSRRGAVGVSGLVVFGLLVAWATDYPFFDATAVARNLVLMGGCLGLGLVAGATKRNAGMRVELAEQRTLVASERAHASVIEERLRLARELHDIVAHSMSVINVQASMGSAAFDAQPEHTRQALANIEQTSRDTLTELRGLLGVLRREDGSRRGEARSITPRRWRARCTPRKRRSCCHHRGRRPARTTGCRGCVCVSDRSGGTDERVEARQRLQRACVAARRR